MSKHPENSSANPPREVDVVLIRPAYGPLNAGFKESRPPAGLLYVAAPLVQAGYNVKIIDQTVEEDWEAKLLSSLTKKTICAGITCLTGPMILNGINLAKLIKQHSDCPVVWGGVHPSLEPETTIASEGVDIIVKGEGEESFLELVDALKEGKDISGLDGIICKKDGTIINNDEKKPYDLNNLPPLPFHLCNSDLYAGNPSLKSFFHFNRPKALSIETSRGCTHRCTYCVMANKFYKDRAKWRGMSAEKIISIVKVAIEDHGISSFTFIDDNFFVDIPRVEKFMDLLEENELDIEWFADIRMDTIVKKLDIPFLQRLEKSGLRSLGIGIESGSDKVLKFLRKGENRETYIEANKMLAQTNIFPNFGFLQGVPTENRDDAEQTYTLVAQMFTDNPNAGIILNKLLPTPNTPLFESCVEHGLKEPEKLQDWANFYDTDWALGPGVWMDKEAASFMMSQLHYKRIIYSGTPRRKNSFIDILLRISTKILLFRIKRKFYGLRIEQFLFELLRKAKRLKEKLTRKPMN